MTAWVEIVRKALTTIVDATGRAASGAKLRSEVAKVAADSGVAFPPEEMTRFSSFIESFDRDFIVLRRPGSDILVAPADRADLFASSAVENKTNYSRMRQDLFEAMTVIDTAEKGVAYYLPSRDSVLWLKPSEQADNDAIPLPMTTLEEEVELRRAFQGQLEVPAIAADEFVQALASSAPLRGFTEVAQAHGLNKKWHFFRLRSLSGKLRDWSVRHGIAWHVDWVSSLEPKTVAATSASAEGDIQVVLGELVSKITADDLSRISVPLDIVLRLLSRR